MKWILEHKIIVILGFLLALSLFVRSPEEFFTRKDKPNVEGTFIKPASSTPAVEIVTTTPPDKEEKSETTKTASPQTITIIKEKTITSPPSPNQTSQSPIVLEITSIQATPTYDSVTIKWKTNKESIGYVTLWPAPKNEQGNFKAYDSEKSLIHEVKIINLNSKTEYTYNISADTSGDSAYSENQKFMWIVIIGIIIVAGLFNPWTGLFGNTLYSYSPKHEPKPEKIEPKHQSFRMTKED